MSMAIGAYRASSESKVMGSAYVIPLRTPERSTSCLLKDIFHAVVEAKPATGDRTIVHDVLDQCVAMTMPMTRKDAVISSAVSVLAVAALFGFSFFA